MDKFKHTSALISRIEKISKKIIKKSLPIMDSLKNEDSNLVDDLMCEIPERYSSRTDALSDLQNASMTWIIDAEAVLRELPSFIIETEGKFQINEDHNECPFLCQVWKGDMYDASEIEGLNALRDDLTKQLSEITSENLFKKV